jgi:hypothetical protein
MSLPATRECRGGVQSSNITGLQYTPGSERLIAYPSGHVFNKVEVCGVKQMARLMLVRLRPDYSGCCSPLVAA